MPARIYTLCLIYMVICVLLIIAYTLDPLRVLFFLQYSYIGKYFENYPICLIHCSFLLVGC